MTATQKKWNGRMVTAPEKPIITAMEARKILGKEYEAIEDDDLMLAISYMHKVVEAKLTTLLRSKLKEGML